MNETIAQVLETVTSVFTSALGWVGQAVDKIAEEPILMVAVVGIPLCGLGIGMARRLLSLNA